MRRIFLLLSLLFVGFTAVAQKSRVAFDKTSYDFGDVTRANKTYTCTFEVTNQTENPLVLLSVNTSCSCLKAHYSRRPMKVGESGVITMSLEAAKMEEGIFHRVVEVQTNAGVYRVVVKGNSVVANN